MAGGKQITPLHPHPHPAKFEQYFQGAMSQNMSNIF